MNNAREDDRFAADERPGEAHVSSHPRSRQIGDAATGGKYGLYPFKASWLAIPCTGVSTTASLFLITRCQQFDIGRIIEVLL